MINARYETISELAAKYGERWLPMVDPGKTSKFACELYGIEAWTEAGWSPAHRVIRHALDPEKRMVRVLTTRGAVTVTDDHSLLRPDGSIVSSKELGRGDALLHAAYPEWTSSRKSDGVTPDIARIMGFRLAPGNPSSSSFSLYSLKKSIIDAYALLCEKTFPDVTWSTTLCNGVYVVRSYSLVALSFDDVVNSANAANVVNGEDAEETRVPDVIMSSRDPEVRRAFLDGFMSNDLMQSTRLLDAMLFYLSIDPTESSDPMSKNGAICCRVTALDRLILREDVYDLTTDNHHFAAGVGERSIRV